MSWLQPDALVLARNPNPDPNPHPQPDPNPGESAAARRARLGGRGQRQDRVDDAHAAGVRPKLLPLIPSCIASYIDDPYSTPTLTRYDHSYFFISSFIDEHINFHADALGA